MDSLFEIVCTIINLLIVIANVVWSIIVFIKSTKNNILRILVLDHNIEYLYDFYNNVDSVLKKLKNKDSYESEKKDVISKILNESYMFQQRFIDLFFDINKDIYNELSKLTQNFIDEISNSIGDDGINLYIETKYNEHISNKISTYKSKMIAYLLKNLKD